MKFLVISQRAYPDPSYRLNNLTGHGRFDILMRCGLGALRELPGDSGHTIYLYFKGKEPQGWIKLQGDNIPLHDEITLAAYIRDNWETLFEIGNLDELISRLASPSIYLLHEQGSTLKNKPRNDDLIILGAQNDLTQEDSNVLPSNIKTISLGETSLLASHSIIYFRQLCLLMENSK